MSRAQAVRGSPALCLHRSGAAPDSLDRAKPVSPRNFPARHGPENSGGRKASQAAVPQGAAGRGAARRRRPQCRKAPQIVGGRKAPQAAGPQGVAEGGAVPQGAAEDAARRHRPGAARRRRPQCRKASQAAGSARRCRPQEPQVQGVAGANMPRTTRNSGGDSIYERLHENL